MANPVSEAFIKANTKVFHIDDGYYFYHHLIKSGRVYLRCVNTRTSNCPARMNVAEDVERRTVGDVRFGERPHNHLPMREWFERETARYRCVQRSAAEATHYRTLYNQETSQLPLAIAGNLPFQAVGQAMYRARKRLRLEIPASLDEYGQVLAGNPRFFTKRIEGPQEFYRATLTDANGDKAILFVSPTILAAVTESGTPTVHVDGTFKVVPNTPACYQLMTMSVSLFNHAFPLVSVLMTSKTQSLYETVFAYVTQHIPVLQPTNIVCDFEQGLQNALRISWPTVVVVGCWFHSANSMNKKARRLGMMNLLQENPAAKRLFKMCQVLALLPADQIAAGFHQILLYAQESDLTANNNISQFLVYVQRVWIEGIGAQSLSVYKQRARTNNNMESYHRRLKDVMGNPHPNIWAFTDGLIAIERELAINFTSLSQGRNPYREPPLTYLLTDQRIRNLTSRLDNGDYSVKEFLTATSHILDNVHNPEDNVAEDEEENVEVQGLLPAWLPPDEEPPIIGPLHLGAHRGHGRGGARGPGVRGSGGHGRGVARGQGGRGGGRGRGGGGGRRRDRGIVQLPQQNLGIVNVQNEAGGFAVADGHQANNAENPPPLPLQLRCHVCLNSTLDLMVALPCGHAAVCSACHPRLVPHDDGIRCPICRQPTTRFLRLHFN